MTMTKILAAALFGICASPAFAGDVGVSVMSANPDSSVKSISATLPSHNWFMRSPWWSGKRRNSFPLRRFTFTCRRGTRGTGACIVRSTTPAAGGSTSCAMTGTITNTCRDTNASTATTIILRAMVMVRVMGWGMMRVMTGVTTMTKDTITKCSFFEDFLPTWIRQSSHTISKLFWRG